MKKIVLLTIVATAYIIGTAQTHEDLEAFITILNSMTPISSGPSLVMESVVIENQQVVMDFVVNDLLTPVNNRVLTPEEAKDISLTSIPLSIQVNPDLYEFYNTLVELGIGLTYRISSEITTDKVSIKISSQELSEALNSEPDFQKIVNSLQRRVKAACPIEVDGMLLINCELKNGFWVNTYDVNGGNLSIDVLRDNVDLIRQVMELWITSSSDESFNISIYYCCMAGYGYCYDFVDSISNEHLTVCFSIEELMEYLFPAEE